MEDPWKTPGGIPGGKRKEGSAYLAMCIGFPNLKAVPAPAPGTHTWEPWNSEETGSPAVELGRKLCATPDGKMMLEPKCQELRTPFPSVSRIPRRGFWAQVPEGSEGFS